MKYLFVLMLTAFALVGCREKNEYVPDPSAIKAQQFDKDCEAQGYKVKTRKTGPTDQFGIPLPGTEVYRVCYRIDNTDPLNPVEVTINEYKTK